MILSAHQPVYLPGIILFNKIYLSDTFVLLSDAQFERSSWQMRNRVRSGETECFLSIPIVKKGKFGQTIAQTKILNTNWKKKHIDTIFYNYKNRPHFEKYFSCIEQMIINSDDYICNLNSSLIKYFCDCLKINTFIVDSIDLPISGKNNERLISICNSLGIKRYISNSGAHAYINENIFRESGIEHFWQNFEHPIYEQGHSFIPNLSIVDLLFNLGEDSAEIVKDCGKLSSTSN